MPPQATDTLSRAERTGAWEAMVFARWPITLIAVLVILAAWQVVAVLSPAPYIVGPYEVAVAAVQQASRLAELSALTAVRVVTGFAVGSAIGILLGLVNGVNRPARDIVEPVVSLTYPIPKIAIFPALAVLIGYTDVSRVFIIALAAFYPAYLAALEGSRGVDPAWVRVARNLGLNRARTFFSVVVPGSLPSVFTGLRISLAVSFVLAYVAEALGGTGNGLGFRIVLVAQTDDYASLYAATLCFALMGILGDRILLWVGRRVTRGRELEVIGDAR